MTLTERQQQVVDLITAGLSGREIAKVLNLSEGTVRQYTRIVMEKLKSEGLIQSRTRTSIAVWNTHNKAMERAIELSGGTLPTSKGERRLIADEIVHRLTKERRGWA